ncbi:hypothetical protein [Gorillibacterium sp. sgz5001074]|uniref:hypothetical protein n=1 Tax=Gorillibacterium sp. sgz5001074 TaxID=3446695 RepID=UPI003F670503
MDELLKDLEELTLEIAEKLQELEFEDLLEFVDQREELLTQLREADNGQQPLAGYQDRIRRLLSHDDAILARMLELKNEASAGLAKIEQGKRQKNRYESAYAADSYFFDQRK